MTKRCVPPVLLVLAILIQGLSGQLLAQGEGLRLPAVISDNMVLQGGKPARIWGWAAPGEQVTVEIAGEKKSVTAGSDGKWGVMVGPLKPGGPVEMKVRGATKSLDVKNILIGDVWLCSGQSNMQFSLQEAANGATEAKAIPQLRLFTTKLFAPPTPTMEAGGKWVECTPETAKRFSAVAHFFGRMIQEKTNQPIGLVLSCQGGTAIECWTPLETLKSDPVFANTVFKYENTAKGPKGFDTQLPSGLFNGMISPLTPLTLTGIIWYQGETNGGRAWQYRKLFPAMIESWRKLWGEEIPFYFVQVASHRNPAAQPVDETWAELREAQLMALSLPKTGMAVALDVGDAANIHPNRKQEVGERLALAALAGSYDQKVVSSGPLYKSAEKSGDKIRVTFTHTGGGLVAKGGPLKRFAIAGDDKKFVWADAVIEGDSVIVSSPQVSAPVAVRYAWADNPEGANLYNQEGLPASPFRTDTWPGVTDTKHILTPDQLSARKTFPPPVPPLPPSVGFTGNTWDIQVGQPLQRTWDMVLINGYQSLPQQVVKDKSTIIWLPYGSGRGMYYEMEGMVATDPEPGSPAVLKNDGSGPGSMTLKFRFDKPITAFGLNVGLADFAPVNAVLVFDYSTDGKTWTDLKRVEAGGRVNSLLSSKDLVPVVDAKELYIRCSLQGKSEPRKVDPANKVSIRTSGDPGWGDASQTYQEAQWKLVVVGK